MSIVTFNVELQPSAATFGGANFGFSISYDPTTQTLAVGAPEANAGSGNEGAVFIYVLVGNTWTLQQILQAPDSLGVEYGNMVSIVGNTLLVADSQHTVSAAPGAGTIFVYTRSGGVWTLAQTINNPTFAAGGTGFGLQIGFAPNGGTFVANNSATSGTAGLLVYAGAPGSFALTQQLQAGVAVGGGNGTPFGMTNTVFAAGNLAGGTGGEVFMYALVAGTWTLVQTLTPSDAHAVGQFGFSTWINGTTVFVGSPGRLAAQGEAYVFTLTAPNTWTQFQELFASDGAASDKFGSSIASDGTTIAIGAIAHGVGGAAYLFQLASGTWTQLQELIPFNPAGGAKFGFGIAILGAIALVAADLQPQGVVAQVGAVYAYSPASSLVTLTFKGEKVYGT